MASPQPHVPLASNFIHAVAQEQARRLSHLHTILGRQRIRADLRARHRTRSIIEAVSRMFLPSIRASIARLNVHRRQRNCHELLRMAAHEAIAAMPLHGIADYFVRGDADRKAYSGINSATQHYASISRR